MTGYGSHPQELDNRLKVTHNLSRFPLPPAAMDRKGQLLQENVKAMRDNHKECLKGTEQHDRPAFVREANTAVWLKRPEQSFYDSGIDYKTEFRTSDRR